MEDQALVGWGWASKQYLQHLWISYRLTSKEYEGLWGRQAGRCAGCEGVLAHPWKKSLMQGLRPEVDHLHIKGKQCEAVDVRGLLCRRCNDFLRRIQDNQAALQNLVNYLKQHGEQK